MRLTASLRRAYGLTEPMQDINDTATSVPFFALAFLGASRKVDSFNVAQSGAKTSHYEKHSQLTGNSTHDLHPEITRSSPAERIALRNLCPTQLLCKFFPLLVKNNDLESLLATFIRT